MKENDANEKTISLRTGSSVIKNGTPTDISIEEKFENHEPIIKNGKELNSDK